MIIKRYTSLFCSALFIVTTAPQADVVTIKNNGFTISNQIVVERSLADSWDGLIHHIGKWWPADHTWWGNSENLSITAIAGGCFCETDGENSAEHMRISFVEKHNLLRMTGGLGPLQGMGMYGALDWQFTSTETQLTKITLTYKVSGITDQEAYDSFAPVVDKVQAIQLGGLGRFLAQKDNE